jgi:hypothetical protein
MTATSQANDGYADDMDGAAPAQGRLQLAAVELNALLVEPLVRSFTVHTEVFSASLNRSYGL